MEYKLILGDAIEEMSKLPNESIDHIITDLPYGITGNKWDEVILFQPMWEQFNRVIKNQGNIVLFSSQPFTAALIMSNPKNFKHEIIWNKTIGSGQLLSKHRPMNHHENILIFQKDKNKGPLVYNPQYTEGKPYTQKKTGFEGDGNNYKAQKPIIAINDGRRFPKSVIEFSNPRIKGGHPTQKPISLLEYLVKQFTNENDLILDCCMGSGSTGIACENLNRDFIGIEVNKKYFNLNVTINFFGRNFCLNIT
jgi:site-specific DNA-methyltransferase (adenine-specific)